MVMPGAGMDGKSIYELLDSEKVNATAAVPTVWLGLLQYLEETGKKLPYLEKVVVGGAACPPMMIRKFELDYGVEVIHGWGMTEMSPLGTTGKMKSATSHLDQEARLKLKEKQGRTPYLVEMKIVDDDGNDLPRDGKSAGHLLVKGPCISKAYYKLDEQALTDDGWFDTGDIANIDPLGYMQITDRDKDVIKSGGEWISSIEVENVAVGCPGVAEAAVIGLPHPKWSERPLLIILREAGSVWTGRQYWPIWMAKSPSGGCPMMSCSSMKSHTPRPVKSRKWNCANSSNISNFHHRVTMNSSAVSLQEIVESAVESHRGKVGALLPVLHSVQDKLGFIPQEAVPLIAGAINLSRAEIHGVMSFYHDFRSEPAGEHIVHLCRAEACQAMGARGLEQHARERLGIDFGETTADRLFTLEPVYCLGNCACSPSIRINDEIHARVSPELFDELIAALEAEG